MQLVKIINLNFIKQTHKYCSNKIRILISDNSMQNDCKNVTILNVSIIGGFTRETKVSQCHIDN